MLVRGSLSETRLVNRFINYLKPMLPLPPLQRQSGTKTFGPVGHFTFDDLIYFDFYQQYNCIMAQQDKKKRGPPVETLLNKQQLQMQGFGTYKLQDAQVLTELLRKGLQLGTCRHIDTARMYNNEIALGTAIQTVIAEGRVRREELFIATKIWNLRGESVQREVKEALQLMQLKYFDMVYLHWPYVDMTEDGQFHHKSLEEFWAEMELCVTKGYVRHLAVSNFNGQLLTELLAVCKIKPVALQIEVHPYLPNNALVELAQKNGLIVIAHTPLIRGDSLNRDDINVLKDQIILDLASKHGRTPAQIVLKYSLQRGVGVIPRTSNPARIQENFQAWSIDLSEDDLKKLRTLGKGYRVVDGKSLFRNIPVYD